MAGALLIYLQAKEVLCLFFGILRNFPAWEDGQLQSLTTNASVYGRTISSLLKYLVNQKNSDEAPVLSPVLQREISSSGSTENGAFCKANRSVRCR